MSGKAPPKGPRALLSSLPASSSQQASTSSPSTSASPAAGTSKIGAPPPTGPRLLNGVPTQPRTKPPGKPLVNGYVGIQTTGPSITNAPTGPRSTQKGKQVDSSWSTSNSKPASDSPDTESSAVASTSKVVSATVADGVRPHEPVKISFPINRRTSLTESRPQPPQPSEAPPPPPP
ncbi:hypothetical protein AZE42_04089, partial [Rhizopogon vesiculosus]